MAPETAYQELVDGRVRGLLSQPTSWPALLTALPGVYPAIIHETARRLRLGDMVRPSGQLTATTETTATVAGVWGAGLLPTPHPLASCWWSSHFAVGCLLSP